MSKYWIEWFKHYNRCPPVGYLLRLLKQDCWFRIHYLPGGKRCPENATDLSLITQRSIEVAESMFTANTEVLIIQSRYDGTQPGDGDWASMPTPDNIVWEDGVDIEELDCTRFFGKLACFDSSIVGKYYKENLTEFNYSQIILSTSTSNLFCPYEGGIDCIIPDVKKLTEVKYKFKDWLPETPTGL